MPQEDPSGARGLTAINGAIALLVVLLIVQIWLLTAALDNYLGGYRETSLPAAIASGLIFFLCLGIYFFVIRVDEKVRRP
jgi:predicted Co/Zn/Cd cation transporter (cation efflux family)